MNGKPNNLKVLVAGKGKGLNRIAKIGYITLFHLFHRRF
jgi:hypothetical protein